MSFLGDVASNITALILAIVSLICLILAIVFLALGGVLWTAYPWLASVIFFVLFIVLLALARRFGGRG